MEKFNEIEKIDKRVKLLYEMDADGYYVYPKDKTKTLTYADIKDLYKGKIKQAIDLPVKMAIEREENYIHPNKDIVLFVKKYCMARLKYREIIKNILSARWLGVSISLVELDRQDGYLVIKDIHTVPPEYYYGESAIGDTKVKLKTPNGEVIIDRSQCIVYSCNDNFGNIYGNSILEPIQSDVNNLHEMDDAWKEFLRKFGIPYTVAYVKEDTNEEKQRKLIEFLEKMAHGGAAVIPCRRDAKGNREVDVETYVVEKSTADYENYLDVKDRDILISLGISPLVFQTGARGTYSLGSIHKWMLEKTVLDCQELVNDVFTRYIVYPLLVANFGERNPGRLKFRRIEGKEFLDEARAIGELAQGGFISPDENVARDRLGLPRADGTYSDIEEGGSEKSKDNKQEKEKENARN